MMISFKDACCRRASHRRICRSTIISHVPVSPTQCVLKTATPRAGSRYIATESGVPPGKLVFHAHWEVEALRTLRLIDDVGSVPIGFMHLGAFLPPRVYADIVMVAPEARKVGIFAWMEQQWSRSWRKSTTRRRQSEEC